MSFITDKQTLDDLNIFGKRLGKSIYDLFNNTFTQGGADLLEHFFLYPLADAEEINQRSEIIQYFNQVKVAFPFKTELFDLAEEYLRNTDSRSQLAKENDTVGRKFNNLIGADTAYKSIHNGVCAVIEIISITRDFLNEISSSASKTPYQRDKEQMLLIVEDPELSQALNGKALAKLSYAEIVEYDRLLRYIHHDRIKKLLYYIYKLDVYISVSKIAANRGFVFPKAKAKGLPVLILEGIVHPHLANAVANDLELNTDNSVVFLTGANMAGKSTFMKTLGISMYLAHMGFPVAAGRMEFSVMDGIYTTINLPDNLGAGTSHFYAEVLRVKKVAKELGLGKNLFVIIDELFRGTNVKDAYEATIAITEGFAKKKKSMFVISTHIIEAGPVLKERCGNISFQYLPTRMEGNDPVYTHRLMEGITSDRHGMVIINNEGILDILRQGQLAINKKEG